MAADASKDTPEPTSTAQAEPDAPLLGFLVIGAILYFTIVWRSLPSDSSRWVVTAAIAAVVTVVWVLAVKLPTVRKGLSSQGAKLAGDFAVFFILVGAVLLASIYLTAEDQVLVLKLFAVLYFSLLPAVLYVQFSSRRTRTVWKEYVLNLFQLHMDDYAHLPEPPELTRYVEPWRRARRAARRPQRAGSGSRRSTSGTSTAGSSKISSARSRHPTAGMARSRPSCRSGPLTSSRWAPPPS